MSDSNEFDLDRIRSSSEIKQLVYHDTLASTNDFALQAVRSNSLDLPALIIARKQLAGRGQPGRRWHSTIGSLTFSIVIHSKAELASVLPLTVGLAVCESIEAVASKSSGSTINVSPIRVGLKWPNDLMVGHDKLGGILVEAIPGQNVVVIGIGINVNNELPNLSDGTETAINATSLFRHLNEQIPLTELVICIFEKTLTHCASCGRDAQLAAINERICFRELSVDFQTPGGSLKVGTVKGVAENGQLILETASRTEFLVSGRIVNWPKERPKDQS